MNGSGFWRAIAALVLVAILIGIGVGVYNAGVSEGVAEAARAAQVAGEDPALVYPPYVGGYHGYGYGWGWGGGFGFFGILFWILGLFLIFGLLRAVFGWGRYGGGRGHGGWQSRDERIAEMHRDLHRRDEPASPSSSPGSSG
jgi:hypothetical protein